MLEFYIADTVLILDTYQIIQQISPFPIDKGNDGYGRTLSSWSMHLLLLANVPSPLSAIFLPACSCCKFAYSVWVKQDIQSFT